MATNTNTTVLMGADRASTWASIGTDVNGKSIGEVLQQARLDYDVELMPVQTTTGLAVPGRFAAVRARDNHVYDIVSNRYEIVQNRDAFDFVNYMDSDGVEFVKAGETTAGMVFIIAKLPEVTILQDSFRPYVIFRNGFNGKTNIAAAICPLRVVCENQFKMAFKGSPSTVIIRHVQNASIKLEEARHVLHSANQQMLSLGDIADKFVNVKLTPDQVTRILFGLFPVVPESANSYAKHVAVARRQAFTDAYEADDNTNFKGTAWGLINAHFDYTTHLLPAGKTSTRFENKFANSIFGNTESVSPLIEQIQAVAG